MYLAQINVPGYLPMDDEPPTFESAKSAWEYLMSERERGEESAYDDTGDSQEFSETYTKLAEIVAALDAQSGRLIAACGISDDGTGVLYGGTPGYEGDHDLGLAYVVTLTEGESED